MRQRQAAEVDERGLLARYAAIALIIIGGIEWFLGRTVSRLAVAPTLEGFPRTVIEVLGGTGIFVLSTSFLLAVLVLCLSAVELAAKGSRERKPLELGLAYYLPLFAATALLHSFLATQAWLNILFNVLSLLAVWLLALRFVMSKAENSAARLAVLLIAVAWTGWYYYVLGPLLTNSASSEAGGFVLILNLGELAAICAVFALFAATAVLGGEWRHVRRWIAPVVVALLFSAANIADMTFDQGFTAVFATWSVGFNLFLPWPVYAVALALFSYSVLTCFSRSSVKAQFASPNAGLGLLLIMFAGYNLQLPYQHVLAVLSMMLITGLARPFDTVEGAGAMHRTC